MTDTEKTLHALRQAGSTGIHSFDLNTIIGSFRSGARVYDLKKQGYIISSIPETKGDAVGCRYFLTKDKEEVKKPIRWEFDSVRGIARPIFA